MAHFQEEQQPDQTEPMEVDSEQQTGDHLNPKGDGEAGNSETLPEATTGTSADSTEIQNVKKQDYIKEGVTGNNGTPPEATTSTSTDSAEVKDVEKQDYIKGGATGNSGTSPETTTETTTEMPADSATMKDVNTQDKGGAFGSDEQSEHKMEIDEKSSEPSVTTVSDGETITNNQDDMNKKEENQQEGNQTDGDQDMSQDEQQQQPPNIVNPSSAQSENSNQDNGTTLGTSLNQGDETLNQGGQVDQCTSGGQESKALNQSDQGASSTPNQVDADVTSEKLVPSSTDQDQVNSPSGNKQDSPQEGNTNATADSQATRGSQDTTDSQATELLDSQDTEVVDGATADSDEYQSADTDVISDNDSDKDMDSDDDEMNVPRPWYQFWQSDDPGKKRKITIPRRPSVWSAQDTVAYRRGYPGKKDNPRLKDNLEFYQNKISSVPQGDFINNIHDEWWGDYNHLEWNHSYIQWLFPIRERGLNMHAQELQLHEAKAICKDKVAHDRVLKSYKMMLNFYGMRLKDDKTGEIERADNWKERFSHLNHSMHNYLRITRILKCLGEVEYEHLKSPFIEFVLNEIIVEQTLYNCLQSCINYWLPVIRDDDERKKLLELADELAEKTQPKKKESKKETQSGKETQPGKDTKPKKTTRSTQAGASKQTQAKKTKKK